MCNKENDSNQKNFMEIQLRRIDVDKWCQGERQSYDPGESYVMDWVYNNAIKFRDEWNVSCCKTCEKHRECGFRALYVCEYYIERTIHEKNTMS